MSGQDFLLLVSEDEAAHLARAPHQMAELLEQQRQFADGLRQRGVLVDHGRLRPSGEGKRVRGGAVADGPFGLALALFYWVRVASLDEAAALGAACPVLATDSVDVRPVMKGQAEASRAQRRGKIFGFGVLGQAPSEAGWSQIMDRIDAETSAGFPPDKFLGGVRLCAPTTGRRVERRATFDGPFMESKEVIGGLFFLRLPSMGDAVAWAAGSRFVAHGALEIRELWRS